MSGMEPVRWKRLAWLRREARALADIEGPRWAQDERGEYIKPFSGGIAARAEEREWPSGSYPHTVSVLARAFQHVVQEDMRGDRRLAGLHYPMDEIVEEVMLLIRRRWAKP